MLVILGVALVVIGGIVILLGRAGLPLGRLPGDIVYRGKNTTFYFPLASCILISVVLSIVLFLIGRMKRLCAGRRTLPSFARLDGRGRPSLRVSYSRGRVN